jgi:endonuclease YncB( thermonuclease family)
LGGLLATLLAPAAAPAANCAPTGHLEQSHVRYVIDGDTVILDSGRHIRIVGLNAPEIGHHGAPDEAYARAARRRLKKLLARTDNQVQWSVAPERRDHYGRTLAHIYVHGKDATRVLLKDGLAAVIAIPPNVRRAACYATAERVAREHRVGLWSHDSPSVHAAADAVGAGFEIAHGRVQRLTKKHAGTKLTLDGHLDLWVPRADRHYFHRSLRALKGRRVLVRGWRHKYHGHAEIVVHHPAVLTAFCD